MRLSVIIVNWNVRDLLRRCLQSLRADLQLPPDDYEIIVVDNASRDGSAAMLRAEFPDVRLIESAVNLGFGAGCNKAYRESKGAFVLLLNPDTEAIDHVVDALLAIMRERPRAGIVAPRLVNADRTFHKASGGALPTLANVAWHYLFIKNVLPAALGPAPLFLEDGARGLDAIGWVSGASMMLRREAIGPRIFDEAFFMFGEDMDVCDRVRRDGWEVLYAGELAIVHHHGRSFDQQPSLEVRACAHEGPRRVFAKRRGRASVFLYDLIVVAGYLARWGLYRLLSWLRPGKGYAKRADFCRGYVEAVRYSRRRAAAAG